MAAPGPIQLSASTSTDGSNPSRDSREFSERRSSLGRRDSPPWEPRSLCSALESASRRASAYERQIKDLESKLSLDLSNSRAIENTLHEVFTGIEQTRVRTHQALMSTVPHIADMLEDDLGVLHELEEQLPEANDQIRAIRRVYNRGKDKAQELADSLEWLNTPVSLRLRAIIFTPNAPVGKRWKVLVRTIFALVFCICLWIAWITARGAIRAHKEGLVWGERLMS